MKQRLIGSSIAGIGGAIMGAWPAWLMQYAEYPLGLINTPGQAAVFFILFFGAFSFGTVYISWGSRP
jgi:hypothetical protein